jgi:dATP pyrophosphohydrolase
MKRAPFQVLVIPYFIKRGNIFYALFKREKLTGGYWQGIAGGGEGNESSLLAAKREAFEEAGIPGNNKFIKLKSLSMISVENVCGFKWGKKIMVIPEYCYGVMVKTPTITLSDEHTSYKWLSYKKAHKYLKWDSNKTALWELDHRIKINLNKRLSNE